MKFENNFFLNFKEKTDLYYKLLKEEDFDFKTKEIKINLKKEDKNTILAKVKANSILELKIGNTAFIKSLEIINKTLEV